MLITWARESAKDVCNKGNKGVPLGGRRRRSQPSASGDHSVNAKEIGYLLYRACRREGCVGRCLGWGGGSW